MQHEQEQRGGREQRQQQRRQEGDAMPWPALQTTQTTYQLITQGERPWNALGDFLNYGFGYATDHRAELAREPIQEPTEVTADLHRWVAFCTASVEYLCERYSIPCPEWVLQPTYNLSEPWFTGLGADKPQIQARLRQETPHPSPGATSSAANACLPISTSWLSALAAFHPSCHLHHPSTPERDRARLAQSESLIQGHS